MERRTFLRAAVIGGTAAFSGALWQHALAASAQPGLNQSQSEITGPALAPNGSRLYFSCQRGTSGSSSGSGGITYEVIGPYRN